ncbi:MAG TPA: lactate utilization protein [Clostridia bacterium]|nr:lactate utilization protein [Clostridia bacterium]
MDINKVLDNLRKNNMNAVFAENRDCARELVKEMLFEDASITTGGSVTLDQCGITKMIREDRYRLVERGDKAAMFSADFILSGTNAITEDGKLYNVDGYSNRVACICHGPKKVIIVAGVNKIVKDIQQAVLRVKHIAAPKNCIRLSRNTPCAHTGKCISDDINKTCDSADMICCNYVISAKQREKGRITVIIVNEELGY